MPLNVKSIIMFVSITGPGKILVSSTDREEEMNEINDDDIKSLIHSRRWYHKFEISPGIFSPGKNEVNPRAALDSYQLPEDIRGKRALDIGAWDGPYSFELERRGAITTALDIQDPDRTGFNIGKKIKKSKVNYIRSSIYDIPAEYYDQFNIVLFLGVFYHLKNPLLAFQKIWRLLKKDGTIYFEGAILDYASQIDAFWHDKTKLLKVLSKLAVCYFSCNEYNQDISNWNIPTQICLKDWLRATGFCDISITGINTGISRISGYAKKNPDFAEFEHGLM
jgi:tRNA (mo5U34)-methyltransferase